MRVCDACMRVRHDCMCVCFHGCMRACLLVVFCMREKQISWVFRVLAWFCMCWLLLLCVVFCMCFVFCLYAQKASAVLLLACAKCALGMFVCAKIVTCVFVCAKCALGLSVRAFYSSCVLMRAKFICLLVCMCQLLCVVFVRAKYPLLFVHVGENAV